MDGAAPALSPSNSSESSGTGKEPCPRLRFRTSHADLLKRPRVGVPPAEARHGKFGATPAADSRQLFIGEFAGTHRIRRHARQLASRQTSAIFRVAPCSNNIHGHLLSSFHSFLITETETSLC